MFLTVSIPTYNRPALLKKNLKEILSQISGYSNLAVFVADDSGEQVNSSIIDELRSNYKDANIYFHLNPKNLGIDENIKNCISMPDSEYIWLMGEDDLLVPGAIKKVLSVLQESKPPFLFVNYINCDNEHQNFASNAAVAEFPSVQCVSFNDFISSQVWALGFIGGCVIKKSEWIAQKVDKFSGGFYSHVGGIIDACIDKNICIIGDVLVLNRAEDINTFTWSKSTFRVYFSFYEMLNASNLKNTPPLLSKSKESAKILFNVFSIAWLAAKRGDGVYDSDVFEKHYRNSDKSNVWKTAAYLTSIFPRWPLKLLRHIHLKHKFSRKSL